MLIDFAYERELPLVATNEPYFAAGNDYESHDALICIAQGPLRVRHRAPPSDARASLQDPRRDVRAVCRSAGGDCRDRRDRAALRVPPAARSNRSCRAFRSAKAATPSMRQPSCATQAQAGLARRIASAGIAEGFTEEQYRERLEFELNVIEKMKYPGYFLDRGRLYPVGQEPRHSGRARPRFGRGIAGVLRAHHYRSRSDALWSLVRTLPQSGTRVDARLRHRFLSGQTRPGDRIRAGALRPRSGRADHHLRHLAGARRVARRRPRVADALRAGRQAVQDGAAKSGRAGDAGARHRGRAETAGRGRRRSDRQARLHDCQETRRPDASRLDPRRRHRDRRP